MIGEIRRIRARPLNWGKFNIFKRIRRCFRCPMPSIHPRVDFIRSPKVSMRFCGPKMSIFGLCLSIWGMLQLVFMSVALHSRSVAFIEDIPEPGPDIETQEEYLAHLERNYDLLAHNCGVAASLYVITFLVSLHQYWMNSKASPTGYQRYH